MKLQIHPFTIERRKLDDKHFTNSGNKVTLERAFLSKKKFLITEGNTLANIIGNLMHERSSKKKKLIKKLRNIDLSFNYLSYPVCDELKQKMKDFQAVINRSKELKKDLDTELSKDSKYRQEQLKSLYEVNGPIYRTIQIINPSIYYKLDKYLQKYEDTKENRKLELVLTRTASHAVTKTSPIGFLNEIHFLGNGKIRSINKKNMTISVNNVFLLYLFEKVLQQDNILSSIALKKNENFYIEKGYIYLFCLTNDITNKKVFKAKDRYIKVKANPLFLYILKSKKSLWNLEDIKRISGLDSKGTLEIIRKMLNYGFLSFNDYFSDGLNSIDQFINSLMPFKKRWNPWVKEIIRQLKQIKTYLDEINACYSLNLHKKIIDLFQYLNKYSEIPTFDPKSFIYIDNVFFDNKVFNLPNKFNSALEDIIKLHSIFDINTKIQQQLIFELRKREQHFEVETKTPWLFNLVGNINLGFQSYWNNPNGIIKGKSTIVNELENLKSEFIEYILNSRKTYKKRIPIVNIERSFVNILYNKIPEYLREKEASYSFFYQIEKGYMIINKIYPGYQSFYNRFFRYTDIPEKYKNEINKYYQSNRAEIVDIYETMGFNANAYDPILNGRLIFDVTLDKQKSKEYKDTYNFYDLSLVENRGELFLETKDKKTIKPVISTSLIRVLYPGKIAFYSSLFSNISLLSDLSCIFFKNIDDDEIITAPRIVYMNVVLSRSMKLISLKRIKGSLKNKTFCEAFEVICRFLDDNEIPTKFFFQGRKEEFKSKSISNIGQEFFKPQYFDIENSLLLKLLLSTIRTTDYLLISELYPLNLSASEYMTEWNYKSEE